MGELTWITTNNQLDFELTKAPNSPGQLKAYSALKMLPASAVCLFYV
jgi:hypothetical protein